MKLSERKFLSATMMKKIGGSVCALAIVGVNFLSAPSGSAAVIPYADGIDTFGSYICPLTIEILSNPVGIPVGIYMTSQLDGQTIVQRSNAGGDGDVDNDGLADIRTQFLLFEHAGNIPALGLGIQIHQSPTRPTLGVVEQQAIMGPLFPANSFFDVFKEIEIQGLPFPLYNKTAVRMVNNNLLGFPPPIGTTYLNDQGAVPWWPTNPPLDPTVPPYPTDGPLAPLPLPLFVDLPGNPMFQIGLLLEPPKHVVPEPGTAGLLGFGIGLIGFCVSGRRSARSRQASLN